MNYTKHFECGCKVVVIGELTNAEIRYCPKHEAAPDMYEALNKWKDVFFAHAEGKPIKPKIDKAWEQTAQALAKAEGTK